MTIRSDITIFRTNPQLKPTFLEDTVIILTKDYKALDPLCNRYLEKGVPGVVKVCGLSIYAFSEDTKDFSKLVDGDEWCEIEVQSLEPDLDYSEGCVKAEDLREVSDEDLELD